MTIGQRIAALRKAAGLSQEALAAELGVSRQAIGKWEADASLPGIDNLQALAKALGASCDELLTGARPSASPEEAGREVQQPILSLEGAKALLAEEQRAGKKRYIPLYAALMGLVALVLAAVCVIFHYTGEVRRMQSQVEGLTGRMEGLDARINSRIGGIEASIRESLEQQASLVADWELTYGAYSAREATAEVRVQATPKTLAEGMTAAFLFTLSDGRAVSADGVLENGVFSAAASLPLADGFSLNMSFSQNGVSQTQQLTQEPYFGGRYLYTVTPGALLPPGASHSSLSPDVRYTREAVDLPITVDLPFLDGRLLGRPAMGTLSLTLGGEVVEQLDFSFAENTDTFYPGATQGFDRVSCTIHISLEEKTFTLPWKAEYENGGWPEGYYTLTVEGSQGELLLTNQNGWDLPAIPAS